MEHWKITELKERNNLTKLSPVNPNLVSDELYNKSIGWLNNTKEGMNQSLGYKTRIIHLIDAVSRGYITPLEAYEALESKYFPIHLELRKSAYQHLIK